MGKWTIDKQFSFCYGHRVWSQQLIGDYCESGDACCKCRHLHGHEGLVHVFLEGDELERGMVTDFKHLGWLKNFLDDNLDHKFIIDRNDPLFEKIINGQLMTFKEVVEEGNNRIVVDVLALEMADDPTPLPSRYLHLVPAYVPGTEHLGGYNLDVSELEGPEQEFYEGFFIVDFLPTSENLSKWVYDCVDAKMSLINVKTAKVDWFETPKSRSSYQG
jgi:6-pyruvoyltetrahydropterin/6-carboxytetrahydropterin synthase